jgi:hypothetical protein
LDQEGEKKLEKEEEKNKLEEDEEEVEKEEQSPKNMPVLTDDKTSGTVTIKIGDREIKKEEEKSKEEKDMETKLLCAEPEAWCGRNESAGESEPEVEEAEGGRSEVRPTCQQQGGIPAAGGGGQAAAAVEILPPELSTPAEVLPAAAVELRKSATAELAAAGSLTVAEIRLAAPTLRQVLE